MAFVNLYINHSPIGSVEWSMQMEEVLGGNGRATIIVQDRTNTWEPEAHWDVKAVIADTGHVVFRGEIVNEPVELPVGEPWRKWKLECSDYNNQFSQRLVGAYDGRTWEDIDGLGDFVMVDPQAHSRKTDRRTIIRLFDNYIRIDGEAIDTTTYVNEYLSDFSTLYWSYSDLQAALEEMAALIVENLQFWLDPDLKFHWQAIPAWYDLLSSVFADESAQVMSMMNPSFNPGDYQQAQYGISDSPGTGEIGGRELQFELDGTEMPEQVYVRGTTGYVYNSHPKKTGATRRVYTDPTGSAVDPEDKEIFKCQIKATTRVWDRDPTDGYIDPTYSTIAAGGPYNVRFKNIPIDPSTGLGGRYWKLLSGPKAGWFIDNDTNDWGWGDIRIYQLETVGLDPHVGVGGSGFFKDYEQDPNKRQTYVDAPVSTTKAKRNAVARQVLYRGSYPTLRGSIKVHGYDGWRVGQIFRLTDARLPSYLNGQYVMIQRVETTLIAGQDIREYKLDFGDGPESRWSMKDKIKGGDVDYDPAQQIVIHAYDLSPGPNSKQVIVGQLANRMGNPKKVQGRVIKWSLEAYTSKGVRTTGGTLTPEASTTDRHGRARTTLKTGPKRGRVYFVFAEMVAK